MFYLLRCDLAFERREPSLYALRKAYAALKAEAAKHGYTGAAYTQLYNEATKIHARRMGIKDTNDKP